MGKVYNQKPRQLDFSSAFLPKVFCLGLGVEDWDLEDLWPTVLQLKIYNKPGVDHNPSRRISFCVVSPLSLKPQSPTPHPYNDSSPPDY